MDSIVKKDTAKLQSTADSPGLTQNGDYTTAINTVENYNAQGSSFIIIQQSAEQPIPALWNNVSGVDYSYYSLIVSGNESFESNSFEIHRDRILSQDSSKEIVDTCKTLTPAGIARLKQFPTIFAAENGDNTTGNPLPNQMAYVGFVTDIQERGNFYKLFWAKLCEIPQTTLVDHLNELQISDGRYGELNWTHWAVKNVNAVEILRSAGHNVPYFN